MFTECLTNVQKTAPLVHCITNYVTVNDVANILLAVGGSPIMADDDGEVDDITSICDALDLNIGTLNAQTIGSMFTAGRRANELRHPVVLDPVGAGASHLRTNTATSLLAEIRMTAVRGNISEIKTLNFGQSDTHGVDAAVGDAVTEANLAESAVFVAQLAARFKTVFAVTGAIDLISDSVQTYAVRNGTPMMSRITGTGCMLSALVAAFCAANPGQALPAVVSAVSVMGYCGEIVEAKTRALDGGTGTFRCQLIDAMSRLDAGDWEKGQRIERLA